MSAANGFENANFFIFSSRFTSHKYENVLYVFYNYFLYEIDFNILIFNY